MGTAYSLAYYAPDYLERDIQHFASVLNADGCFRLGSIDYAPNVMLVGESTETGHQGYVQILKEQASYRDTASLEELLCNVNPTDVLLFPGRYDAAVVMKALNRFKGRLHMDVHYDGQAFLENTNREIDTLFLSTSSPLFLDECKRSQEGMLEHFRSSAIHCLLLKENRGGSSAFFPETGERCQAPSFPGKTVHSVGVGDVYDAVFIHCLFENHHEKAMRMAALCAGEYAKTLDYQSFKETIQMVLSNEEFMQLKGNRLAWDQRTRVAIYIAAPDFPDVDTKPLDALCDCLKYHNFFPRRPIQENGLAEPEFSTASKYEIYQKDILLLDACPVVIAVLLNNDPGTLVELGIAKQAGKQTILFDPEKKCTNIFARFTPDYYCVHLSEVIEAVFSCLGEDL